MAVLMFLLHRWILAALSNWDGKSWQSSNIMVALLNLSEIEY